ncbi:MAG TPA: ATP-binding protein [Verrucomicrobiales bacterium]|nr:ATP-binding protein [Verrucomicrobiales bacterium]
MPTFTHERTRRGLFLRAALFSTLLVIFSVGPCAFLFIRHQEAEALESLKVRGSNVAEMIAASVRLDHSNKAREPVPKEPDTSKDDDKFLSEYGDLCSPGSSLEFILYVPKRGLSQFKDRSNKWLRSEFAGWGMSDDSPAEVIRIGHAPNGTKVLLCSCKVEATKGDMIGSVHIGIPLNAYEHGQRVALENTVTTSILAFVAGITGSFFLARKVTRPLSKLCDMAQGIASGDLASRAALKTSGEVQHLANTMNLMAEKLEQNATVIRENQRDLEEANVQLQERVLNRQLLARISGDFLHTEISATDSVFRASLEGIAHRLQIDGVAIFLFASADQATLQREWEWHRPEAPECSLDRVPIAGFPWASGLAARDEIVVIADSAGLPVEAAAEKANLERLGIRSAAAALLGAGEKAAGYLFLRHHAGPRAWTSEEEQFILIAAGIFSNALARRDAALERERLQSQLLQAQKMEAVGKLSGGIAHDFNNMLVPIVGYSDSILSGAPADAPWLHEIREIKRSAESAASLTRQLLSFSRKQIISRKELDLNSLIETLQHMLRRLIGENIKLQTDLASDMWSIAADSGQIEQCLMNLAVNAKAAMPHGGSIHISTEMVDSEDAKFVQPPLKKIQGLFVKLSVRDTGCGMDEVTLSRIFEPFFSTKGEEGTGLGLSVVYGVVEEHGGWITVESAPGKGTSFHLWLPAMHEPVPAPIDTVLTTAPPLAKGKGQRVLIVEDESGVLAFVSAALRQNGYKILTADCGTAARQIFEEEADNIDLVMSDVVLPDTTGVQLLEEFFTLKPDLKALLTSGYSEKHSLVELVRKRGLFFLHKPYTLIQLLEAVNNALHGQSTIVVA